MRGDGARDQGGRGPQQRNPVGPLAEQHRDQGDGAQVVDDGQGQKEDPQRRRQSLAHETEDGQGEGDVCGQGDGPAGIGRPDGAGQQQIDRRRPRHAAQGRQHRRRQLPGIAQFAAHDLVFDLQPHHEEEDRHQPFLDPVGDRLLQPDRADLKHVTGLQPGEIVGRPGRVGDHQGGDGGQRQGQAGCGLGLEEIESQSARHGGLQKEVSS